MSVSARSISSSLPTRAFISCHIKIWGRCEAVPLLVTFLTVNACLSFFYTPSARVRHSTKEELRCSGLHYRARTNHPTNHHVAGHFGNNWVSHLACCWLCRFTQATVLTCMKAPKNLSVPWVLHHNCAVVDHNMTTLVTSHVLSTI